MAGKLGYQLEFRSVSLTRHTTKFCVVSRLLNQTKVFVGFPYTAGIAMHFGFNTNKQHNVFDFKRHISIDLRSTSVANELQRAVTFFFNKAITLQR